MARQDDIPHETYEPAPLVGHHESRRLVRTLENAGKMPHGILLYGPEGIGKRLFAENLAWGLICGFNPEKPDDIRYNKTSPLVPVMAHGAHAGYGVLSPEGSMIKVEQVRHVVDKLSLADEGWRVVIVDAADDLNAAPANALLKTLEEPLGRTLLILVSHSPAKLLPTIISRCRKIRLSPLDEAEMDQVLTEHLGLDVSQRLKDMADGAPGRAVELHHNAGDALNVLDGYIKALENNQPQDPLVVTEQLLASSADAHSLFDILLWLLADKSRRYAGNGDAHQAFEWGQAHQQALEISADMHEYNLTPQLALERILSDILTLSHQNLKAS